MASKFNPPQYLPSTPRTELYLPQNPKPFISPPTTLIPDPKLVINGGSTLSGHVTINGSKNSALPILAATLCCSGFSKLKNVPCLSDTTTMVSILESLGARVMSFGGDIVVNTDGIVSLEPDLSDIGKIRGGFFVLGPLLARFGEAIVGLPGGCDIGARPVDLYIHGLRALGATVELSSMGTFCFCSSMTSKFNVPQVLPPSDPKLVVNGESTLSGHVTVTGSKNSALPILAATLCCSGSSNLKNVPCLSDTRTMASILESLGAQVMSFGGDMGHYWLGFGEASVGFPGGGDIGARPVDLYIHGLRALGATVELRDGKVKANVSNGKGLTGASFRLGYPSVGATETLMMAACMAEGKTVISNAAQEPEIIDLAGFLTNCGAVVEGAGTDTLYITGRRKLYGSEYSIMPDRIEVGTYMLAAAITRSCISISPVPHSNLTCLVDKLSGAGCKILQLSDDTLELSAVPRTIGDDLRGFNIKTNPFPGFPTDLQQLTMALLSTCKGVSIIEESVFENRMSHVTELQKFGAKIQVCGNRATVYGKGKASPLRGSQVNSTDLRGGMSLVLAGLAAEGITEISGISHIDRGYESLEMKLQGLGANVIRTTTTFPM
ncbi:hypothetical protein H5410_038804 [Solanum commersonii]|uniref:UDP-N-acetylglucosamine 1-carboxyvinyltransferase n=1 Tax=Solanum commersonii TaxID=4109 RepID=A0A9J5YE79_SOLCO|nr:hypothetical protein H5410_038804 [Solanum commersonii]